VHAALLTSVSNVQELKAVLSDETISNVPKLILGGGSNILFTADYPGLVILNNIKGITATNLDNGNFLVTAGAGENWHQFVLHTVSMGWGGLENLSLIPGTVGAAPIQNIGAYGVEVKDVIHNVEAVSLKDGSIVTFSATDCHFGYRDSIFKRTAKGQYVITAVSFKLTKNPTLHTSYGAIEDELKKNKITQPGIAEISQAVINIRTSKLPDPKKLGNAGSFFKNPEIDEQQFLHLKSIHTGMIAYPSATPGKMKLAAGWLIEQCGWKGKRIGHVGMHEQQALVLVNYGGATGKELLTHAECVRDSVLEKFGVLLEMEVNIL
jgi:UDP-N-acetylmuramate dehydrogenase